MYFLTCRNKGNHINFEKLNRNWKTAKEYGVTKESVKFTPN